MIRPQLTQALDLWRGPPSPTSRDTAAAGAEIARLDDLRAIAIEELADARLALGEHTLAVDLATAALDQFPLRERLTASLMIGLYRGGRQAEALRAYAQLARRLDEDLGLTPSPELRRLEEDVLLQRSNLDFAPGRTPSQPMTQLRAPIARFIGRRVEVGVLLDALGASGSGPSQLILVSGPAGVGKTTLTEEFCARARQHAAAPLIGHCDPQPTADYQPIGEILRSLVEPLSPPSRSTMLPSALALLLPDVIDPPTETELESGAEEAQYRLFEAIATTMATLASRPTVLVLEDLHWADRPTLRLIRHLVRHPKLEGVLVIATYRDEIDAERAELIERLTRSAQRTKIELSGFDDHEVRALVRATAPPETMHTLVELTVTLHDVTGGNPLFLRELLRELDEQVVKVENTAELSETISAIAPVGVRALVDRRLARLTEHAHYVICAAATVGRELTVDALATICELSHDVAFEALEEGLAARLLVEDYNQIDRYLFPHAVVRNAVYATIPPVERQHLHRRIAEVLERQIVDRADAGSTRRSADIAHHYVEAAPLGLHREAAVYAERAADDAAQRFAFGEAARWYEQAIHFRSDAPCDSELGRLQLAVGRAWANDKQIERARDALLAAAATARRADDAALLADVALEADGPWADGSVLKPDALALLEEALPGIDPSDHKRLVRVLTGIASDVYYTDHDRQGRLVTEALDVARQDDDPETLATALLAVHLWKSHFPEARGQRLELARQAYELASIEPAESVPAPPGRIDRSRSTSSRIGRSPSSRAISTPTRSRRTRGAARVTSTRRWLCGLRRRSCTEILRPVSSWPAAPRFAVTSSSRSPTARTSSIDSWCATSKVDSRRRSTICDRSARRSRSSWRAPRSPRLHTRKPGTPIAPFPSRAGSSGPMAPGCLEARSGSAAPYFSPASRPRRTIPTSWRCSTGCSKAAPITS